MPGKAVSEQYKILFIEDEEQLRKNIQALLIQEGYHVDTAENGQAGIELLEKRAYDIVLTDLLMPDVDGLEVMEFIKETLPNTLGIVITGYASLESAVQAMRKGAYDYVSKPLDFDFLKLSIDRAIEKIRLKREIQSYYEQLETKVIERTRELREMQAQLIQTEKLAAIGELAAVVAHEIKNPLVAIGGFARLLRKRISDPHKVRELTAIIVDEVGRLERILKNLLHFTKESEPSLIPENLNSIIEKTMKVFHHELDKTNIRLKLDLAGNLPVVMVDNDQFRQVLVNMTRNAIHAMPEGGELSMRTSWESGQIRLDITDTGMGIPEEDVEKIFEPFYTKKSGGTGLGLPISAKMVEDHGGLVRVSSSPGKGTTFSILLPIHSTSDEDDPGDAGENSRQ